MNPITKTFGAMALSAVVAGGGVACYIKSSNTDHEEDIFTESLEEREFDGEFNGYKYTCQKSDRTGHLVYFAKLSSGSIGQATLTEGLSARYQGGVHYKIPFEVAKKTVENFCQTGEFNGPTTE